MNHDDDWTDNNDSLRLAPHDDDSLNDSRADATNSTEYKLSSSE